MSECLLEALSSDFAFWQFLLDSPPYTASFVVKRPSMSLLSRGIQLVPGMFIYENYCIRLTSNIYYLVSEGAWTNAITGINPYSCCSFDSIADAFYALFYLGLYCEARGEASKAALYMQQATATEYATSVGQGDYMTACARVHCHLRGWTSKTDR